MVVLLEFNEAACTRRLALTRDTTSIAGDHIVSCLKPGKLRGGEVRWGGTHALSCASQLMRSMSPGMPVQREGLAVQEESVASKVKEIGFFILPSDSFFSPPQGLQSLFRLDFFLQ